MGASSSSSNKTASTTSQADNRKVFGNGSAEVGAFGTYMSDSGNSTRNDTSFLVNDSSQHNTAYTDARSTSNTTSLGISDSSQRNTTYTDGRAWTDNSSTAYTDASQRNTAYTDSRNLSDASQRSYFDSGNVTNIGTDGGAVQIAGFNANLLQAVSSNQGDTVRFLAQMGADGISKQAGAATDLFATSSTAAEASWAHTIDKSSELIDHLMLTAQGTVAGANAVASQAVASFTPTANKQADAFKYAAIAAGALIAIKVFKG